MRLWLMIATNALTTTSSEYQPTIFLVQLKFSQEVPLLNSMFETSLRELKNNPSNVGAFKNFMYQDLVVKSLQPWAHIPSWWAPYGTFTITYTIYFPKNAILIKFHGTNSGITFSKAWHNLKKVTDTKVRMYSREQEHF
jgi:hypothetical protein